MILIAHIFRTVLKEEKASLEDLKSLRVIAVQGSALSSDERSALQAMAQSNYRKPKEKRPLQNMAEHLAHADTRFYLLKKEDKVLSFVRFDQQPDGSKYGASFHVDSRIQRSGLGEAMLTHAMKRETEAGETVRAAFMLDSGSGTLYVDRLGFLIKDVQKKEGQLCAASFMTRALKAPSRVI
jgi:hypothetical protein